MCKPLITTIAITLLLMSCSTTRQMTPETVMSCPDDDVRATQTIDCPTTALTAEGTFGPVSVDGAAFAKLDTMHLMEIATQQGTAYENVAAWCDDQNHLGNFGTDVKMDSGSGPTHQVIYDLDVWAANGSSCQPISIQKIFLLAIGANFPIQNWFVYRDNLDSAPIESGDIEKSAYLKYPQGDYITYEMVLKFSSPLNLVPGEHTHLLFVVDTEQRITRKDAFLHIGIEGDADWRTTDETEHHRRWFKNELAGDMSFHYTPQ